MDESVVRQFEKQQVGKPKLSQAIRIGAAMTRPSSELPNKVWMQERDGKSYACVIGAAWLGSGRKAEDRFGKIDAEWLAETFGLTAKEAVYVHHAYEQDGLTREEIADIAESVGL